MQPIKKLEQEITESQNWLKDEYIMIQAGRITPATVDSVMVSVYGDFQPLKACATIGIEGARTLKIAPWDNSLSKSVETALRDANLPVSISVDSSGIRVTVPQMTEDSRKELVKLIGKKQEEARIKIRGNRQDCDKAIDEMKKAGELSEDDAKRLKKNMQDAVDAGNRKLDEFFATKEKEIMTV